MDGAVPERAPGHSQTTANRGETASRGFRLAKVNPKHLDALETSHTPFSAMAELIDNAYDPDVLATDLWIDKEILNGKPCLVFRDNGNGMDLDHLEKMLSLGFCEKGKYMSEDTYEPIGQYGAGFKAGSMRLAKDALVFTVHNNTKTASVGLLSRTLCRDRNLESLVLPMMEYTLPDLERSNVDLDMDMALDAILCTAPYGAEEELKKQLRQLGSQKKKSGTKIVLFHLKWTKASMLELDFESDPHDIRNPETHDDNPEAVQQQTTVFEYRQSLRAYCSILFQIPRMNIYIRGKQVQKFLIVGSLTKKQTLSYKPKGKDKATEIIFGYQKERSPRQLEDDGMMMYYRNRLIEPYVKLACQERTPPVGKGVVGVVDVSDLLEATQNKQEFKSNTMEYRTTMKTLSSKLEQYCGCANDNDATGQDKWDWVACDRCNKWRRLPAFANNTRLDGNVKWYCFMNPDQSKNRCEFPEEIRPDDEYDLPASPDKTKPTTRGRGRGRGRGAMTSTVTSNTQDIAGTSMDGVAVTDTVPASQPAALSSDTTDKSMPRKRKQSDSQHQGNDKRSCSQGPSSDSGQHQIIAALVKGMPSSPDRENNHQVQGFDNISIPSPSNERQMDKQREGFDNLTRSLPVERSINRQGAEFDDTVTPSRSETGTSGVLSYEDTTAGGQESGEMVPSSSGVSNSAAGGCSSTELPDVGQEVFDAPSLRDIRDLTLLVAAEVCGEDNSKSKSNVQPGPRDTIQSTANPREPAQLLHHDNNNQQAQSHNWQHQQNQQGFLHHHSEGENSEDTGERDKPGHCCRRLRRNVHTLLTDLIKDKVVNVDEAGSLDLLEDTVRKVMEARGLPVE